MSEIQDDEPAAQKRKISESPDPESGIAKRQKVDRAGARDANEPSVLDGNKESDGTALPDEHAEPFIKPDADRPRTGSSKGSEMEVAAASASAEETQQQQPGSGPGRRDFRLEEKKRGQRLFGGLLSALNQNKPNTHQVKRLEIERRQQERAQQQRLEDDKRRTEKLAELNSLRKIEQVKFDEQVMQTRHSNMLAMASSLQTKGEPKIFYRPWLLTERQERTIEEQIREAEGIIAKEVQEFKRQKERRLKELGALLDSTTESYDVGEPAPSKDANPHAPESKVSDDKEPDEPGDDEMEQDKEDAVLY